MNRSKLTLLLAGLGIIGLSLGFISWLSAAQALGEPGVRTAEISGTNRLEIVFPDEALGVPLKRMEPGENELAFLPADTSLGRCGYSAEDGFGCVVSVVLMGTDRTSIHRPQICLTGQGWALDPNRSEHVTIAIERPHRYALPVRKLVGTKSVQTEEGAATYKAVFVYWFVEEDRLTSKDWERMLWMAGDLVTQGVLQRWAYVACYSICLPGQEDAVYARMEEFIADFVPGLQTAAGPPDEGGAGQ